MNDLKIYKESDVEKLKIVPEASFEDCEFQGIDFTVFDFKSVSFMDCKFSNCNLANLKMTNAVMLGTIFETCNLIGINWCGLKRLSNPQFLNSKLNFSIFQGLNLKKVEFINCAAVDVDFSETDLSFGKFSNSNLSGSNFEKANMVSTDFRGAQDYLFDIRTARIKGAKFSLPDVISLITALGVEVD